MTSSEKKLARALKDAEVTGLSNSDVRLIKIRIAVLSEMVAREHDARLIALEKENAELRSEIERLRPSTNELDEFIKQHGVK